MPTTTAQIQSVPLPSSEPDVELLLDVDRRVVRWMDREMPLTRLEHDFLQCLVNQPGQVWTYQRLHHALWYGVTGSRPELRYAARLGEASRPSAGRLLPVARYGAS